MKQENSTKCILIPLFRTMNKRPLILHQSACLASELMTVVLLNQVVWINV